MPRPSPNIERSNTGAFENTDVLEFASPHRERICADTEDRTAIARSLEAPLEFRIEAYEDLIDSEIGDTALTRARNLEREFGLRQLYLKFEGGNPTGTHKDRIAFAQAMDALRRGFDAITAASCGNYGAALAFAADRAGLRCTVFVPETYQTRRIQEIESYGATIVRMGADYESAVSASRRVALEQEVYDANPGGDNTVLQLRAYGEIASEIYDELRDAPAALAVSVSNGTTLAGIHRGFVSLYRRGKTSRIPRIIAGSAYNQNPIVKGFEKKKQTCADLSPRAIRETAVNEPLVNWHSIDGDLALEAIRHSRGWAQSVSDRNMISLAKLIRENEGLAVLPAATAGLHALLQLHRKAGLSGDRYVAVLTGRRL